MRRLLHPLWLKGSYVTLFRREPGPGSFRPLARDSRSTTCLTLPMNFQALSLSAPTPSQWQLHKFPPIAASGSGSTRLGCISTLPSLRPICVKRPGSLAGSPQQDLCSPWIVRWLWGRSSRGASPALNRMLCASLGPMLASRVFPHFLYFPSALNPADDPTRSSEVRPPACSKPNWWTALEDGNPSLFDSWLAGIMGPDAEGFRQSSLFELGGDRPIIMRSNRALGHKAVVAETPKSDEHETPKAVLSGRAMRSHRRREHRLRAKAAKAARARACMPPVLVTTGQSLCQEAQHILACFDSSQFCFVQPGLRLDLPGALDLFSGKRGVARSLARFEVPWVLTFELDRGADQDLDSPRLRKKLEWLIDLAAFKIIGGAPVCSSFSRAVRPPVRSTSRPAGFPGLSPGMFAEVCAGNSQNQCIYSLRDKAVLKGLHYWFENPDSSFFWALPGWEQERPADSARTFRYDNCRFGTPWRKRSKIATNLSLAGARLLCRKKVKHLRLSGYSHEHKCSWTRVAQTYPAGLCRVIALSAASAAGWSTARPLDPAACAKCGSGCRVGEAQNPGPRHPTRATRVLARGSTLEAQPTSSAASRILSDKAWSSFLSWSRSSLSFDPLPVFYLCPQLLAMALRASGDYLYNFWLVDLLVQVYNRRRSED